MVVDGAVGADSQQLLLRASDLMFEALMLLDRAQNAHAAALLDNAIALLPPGIQVCRDQSVSDQSDNRSSILR